MIYEARDFISYLHLQHRKWMIKEEITKGEFWWEHMHVIDAVLEDRIQYFVDNGEWEMK